ncbi:MULTISPECIES: acyl carrier protein [unclassified Nonomuraea]|uniref:acyl carrier protein n=1 Tax=unclassified Nonomuraea TaxID=2593643 RepID=UPI003411C135
MTDDQITDVLRGHCARVLGVSTAQINPHTDLREELDADSLDFAELYAAVEDEWGTFADETLQRVRTVADMAAVIRRHLTAVGG